MIKTIHYNTLAGQGRTYHGYKDHIWALSLVSHLPVLLSPIIIIVIWPDRVSTSKVDLDRGHIVWSEVLIKLTWDIGVVSL